MLLIMGISGGLLAMVMAVIAHLDNHRALRRNASVTLAARNKLSQRPVPYAVAIAAGAFATLGQKILV